MSYYCRWSSMQLLIVFNLHPLFLDLKQDLQDIHHIAYHLDLFYIVGHLDFVRIYQLLQLEENLHHNCHFIFGQQS